VLTHEDLAQILCCDARVARHQGAQNPRHPYPQARSA
jgi:hypothetical protein